MARQDDLKAIHTRAIKETQAQNHVADNLKCIYSVQINDDQGNPYLAELSVLRRGFKIQWTSKIGMYELLRTNTSEFYKWVDTKDIDIFLEEGFIRTVDKRQLKRDRSAVSALNKKIGQANSERNDSLMVHWRQRRIDLIDRISKIEESL
jgi:hypothetical protein